jgi:hypothetical protein
MWNVNWMRWDLFIFTAYTILLFQILPLITRKASKHAITTVKGMSDYPSQQVSSIDFGLPLEAQVLSQFFDADFIPADYINALVSTSLNSSSTTTNNNSISGKSTELNTASSLRLLSQRCAALSTHFNEYTNELTRRFDENYDKLVTSSSQIISYSSSTSSTKRSDDIVTRLQYHLATLNTSMYSLLEDLNSTRAKLAPLDPETLPQNDDIENLKILVSVQRRIEDVKAAFNLLKSLVESTETPPEETNTETEAYAESKRSTSHINIEEFKSAISVLRELMQEQVSNEISAYHNSVANNEQVQMNERLMKIVENMINLQPLFKGLVLYQPVYASFVEFLKIQRSNYRNLFD